MGDRIYLKDTGEATTWERTPEGYLKVNANLARPGVQEYYAGELPRALLPPELQNDSMRKLHMLRPAEEVFGAKSLKTYEHKPVTNDHPLRFVDASNYSASAPVGVTVGQAKPKSNYVNMDLLIQDAPSIKAVEEGKRQLSVGYETKFNWVSGNDPLHGAYDGVLTDIVANHIAIVDKGRAGAQVQINDTWMPRHPDTGVQMGDTINRKIGGLSVEFSGQGAQAIDTLIASLDAEIAKGESMAAKITDHKAEVDKLQGKLDAEESSKLTDAQIETLVNERVALVDHAKTLHPKIECSGKTPIAIKSECIAQIKDGFNLDGKSDEYISAVFDALDAPKTDEGLNALTGAINDAAPTTSIRPDPMAEAQKKLDEINATSWKPKGVK